MKIQFTRKNILRGALIYSAGDTVASFILNEFMWSRLAGIILIGATLYAVEIPNYFDWIESRVKVISPFKKSLFKTGLAILYFNPLWIARHLAIIQISSGKITTLSWDILRIASWSFLVNIPISIVANYMIQNKIKAGCRFYASAVFSALMAVYYALAKVLF